MSKLVLRIDFHEEARIGQDQIRLLELVAETGSIARAARAMSTSYKRAWYMLRDVSAMFSLPLLETVRGGSPEKGARLTPFAKELVWHYRNMELESVKTFSQPLKWLENRLTDDRRVVASKRGQRRV